MSRHILLVGIGQTGGSVAESFTKKMNIDSFVVNALAVDTDQRTLDGLDVESKIAMVDERSLDAVADKLGPDELKNWFPCSEDDCGAEFIKSLRMNVGANQWRMKAFLSFCAFMGDAAERARLDGALAEAVEKYRSDEGGEPIEIYTVASLAGGTGSALFLPLSLYIKRYLSLAGCAVANSHAMLTMPDIYENCYGSEQRIKSYANAYAALRELNAVNLTVFGSKEERLSHPPVDFRIGGEGRSLEKLFDSEEKEYGTPDAAPFDRVTLFERIPSVNSPKLHFEIITDAICSLCHDKKTQEEQKLLSQMKISNAVYGGISLTKVKYPYDSIVEYIVSKQLLSLIENEIETLHTSAKDRLTQHCAASVAYGFMPKADTSLYCEFCISSAEAILNVSGSEGLIGRRESEDGVSPISPDKLWDVRCLDGLDAELDASLACESAEIIMRESVVMSNDKKKKGAARRAMLALAQDMRTHLQSYYRNALRSLSEGRDEFISSLLCEDESSAFSPARDLLSIDRKRLHPAYALLRLCLAYQTVKSRIKCEVEAELPPYKDAKLPSSFLLLDEEENPTSRYMKLGSERFVTLCDNDEQKLADDESAIRHDVGSIYAKMVEYFRSVRYHAVLSLLDSMINTYRAIFDAICSKKDDRRSDVKLASLYGSADGAGVIHVGAKPQQKESLANAYTELYAEDAAALAKSDLLLGELTFKVAKDMLDPLTDTEDRPDAASAILDGAAEGFRQTLTQSEFFGKYIDRTLIEVILRPDPLAKKQSAAADARLFSGRYLPIRIGQFGNHAERRAVRTVTKAILPLSAREYLERETCGREGDTPERFVEKLMYQAGEYHGIAAFSSHPNDREMYVRREILNMPLHLAELANERGVDCTPYISYGKAMQVSRAQLTQMWNPALTYDRGSGLPLPFIDPDMRKEYELSTAKALLAAAACGDLSLGYNDEGDEIYRTREDAEIVSIERNEENIKKSDVRELFLWAYGRTEWTRRYADRYDRMLSADSRRMPALDLCDWNRRNVVQNLRRADSIDCLARTLFDFVLPLADCDAPDANAYTATFARVADSTIRALSLEDGNMSAELAAIVYNSLLDRVLSPLCQRLERDAAQSLIDSLCKQGLLLSHRPPRDFFAYTLRDAESADGEEPIEQELP